MYYSLWDIAETIEVKMMGVQTESMFDLRPAVAAFDKKVKASEVVFFSIVFAGTWYLTSRRD